MKLKRTVLIPLAGLLCAGAQAQLTGNTLSLPMTNVVEIGQDVACEILKGLDSSETGISKHLLLDGAGRFKGILYDTKAGQTFIFDSTGLLDLIVQSGAGNTVNIFSPRGEWLYVVKDKKHLFDVSGRWKGVLSITQNGQIVFIKAESADSRNVN